jgi:hypothetical protein
MLSITSDTTMAQAAATHSRPITAATQPWSHSSIAARAAAGRPIAQSLWRSLRSKLRRRPRGPSATLFLAGRLLGISSEAILLNAPI